jgi:hypothetical protein
MSMWWINARSCVVRYEEGLPPFPAVEKILVLGWDMKLLGRIPCGNSRNATTTNSSGKIYSIYATGCSKQLELVSG